jgi:signal transduction histidine kinase
MQVCPAASNLAAVGAITARLKPLVAGTRPEHWLAAGAFLLVAEFEVWVEPVFENGLPGPRLPLAVLAASAVIPLAWRRRSPFLALGVMTGSLLLIGLIGKPQQSGLEFALALMLGLYSVAAHGRGHEPALGALIVLAAGGIYEWLAWTDGDTAIDVLVPYLLFGASWIAGREVAHHRAAAAALEAQSALVEEARQRDAETAVGRERTRIARELHDIVSHGISIMGLQAAAARRTLAPGQHEQREALLVVERMGREALAEMQRLLGVLRTGDDLAGREPLPALSSIQRLVDESRCAGLQVDLAIEGETRPLPAGIELTAYRVVQEALTNVRKHAFGASACVRLQYLPEAVRVVVVDNGPGRLNEGASGHGLIGMRERVTLHGGELRAESSEAGGFVVDALLPVAS